MSITFTDLFCGAGGSSTGLVNAGMELKLAANHWKTAIETHAANHPTADHWSEDINKVDMRRLPHTRALWASPICTEISPAGGRRRNLTHGQLSLLEEGPIDKGAFDRTRATAYDVIRATEIHKYDVVMCENVTEFATDWDLFDWWRDGMHLQGYTSQVISASSAHLGSPTNPLAPQWRDRVYMVFARKGVKLPKLAPTPLAHCFECGKDVNAVQSWRNGQRIGKYKAQYDYRCPESACRHSIVEPYIAPAASIIDWANLGTRVGDRARPLAEKTMARIRSGLLKYPTTPSVMTVNRPDHDGRAFDPRERPMPTRAAKMGEALLVPRGDMTPGEPFVVEFRNHSDAQTVRRPLATVTASGNHHGLVIPYRKGEAKPTSDPILTLATRDSAGIATGGPDPEDCLFRMLQPREQLLAQRFPKEYIVHGNKGEQTMQAGNAVSVNAAQWLGEKVMAALDAA